MMTTDASPRHGLARQTWASAIGINIRVIGALMMRDASSRFGHGNIGIFWVMGEPLILTCGVMIIWTLLGGTHGHDIGVIPFVLSGYTMLTLWRHIIQRSTNVIRDSTGLLYHRNVRLLDILIARAIIEMLGILAAFFIAYVPLALTGWIEPMRDPLPFLGAWVLLTWFTFSLGMIIAALTQLSEISEHFVTPVMYLTIPVTGAFYMVSWLPSRVQTVMLWSPLVNLMEMFRSGLFSEDVTTIWSASYVVVCCFVLNVIGLGALLYAQDHIEIES